MLLHDNILTFNGWFELDSGSTEKRFCLVSPLMKNGNALEYLTRNPGADIQKIVRTVSDTFFRLMLPATRDRCRN